MQMPAQNLLSDRHTFKILNMETATVGSVGIHPNESHQQLMNSDCNSVEESCGTMTNRTRSTGITKLHWITVIILCYVNLINYMDRFTVAGILTDILQYYGADHAQGGLLQTAFVLSYMVFAPLFGYLGDRYNRKYIMAFGVFLWSLTTLLGSFMNTYEWFLTCRALVGIGEASYSTIAPTIISDMFVSDMRSKMLAMFYFAIPVGSGLGYIIGSETMKAAGSWQWGLRVTPIMGIIAVILVVFVMKEPNRGEAEGNSRLTPTSWMSDLRALAKNRSFVLSSAGFTCVAFVAGALSWWGPMFIHYGLVLQPGHENDKIEDVSYLFGVMAMIAGLIGVPAGSFMATKLRPRYPKADPYICAFGLLVSTPLLFCGAISASSSAAICYTCVFFGQVFLNLNWAIVADMLLYVVVPTRRSTAEALQILGSHALGDAGSPYIVGVISDALIRFLSKASSQAPAAASLIALAVSSTVGPLEGLSPDEACPDGVDPRVCFHSLQYSLFLPLFVEVIGGLFFIITAMYIVEDRKRVEALTAVASEEYALRSQVVPLI
ncbi:protein spinster isoform X2 [Ischnura elegans]|uniref:protein spinster isoform X2 n=1 Tax=Ischnura elegans TaxID=197161 RepID=UPI001ED8B9E4|nr:protein spinster isoform X2 [Ischnura elegans]